MELKDEYHYTRYCRPSFVDELGVNYSAFEFKKDEEYLSINWFEYFSDQHYKRIFTEMTATGNKFNRKGYLLKLNVGLCRSGLKDENISSVSFRVHDETTRSYGGIHGLEDEDFDEYTRGLKKGFVEAVSLSTV